MMGAGGCLQGTPDFLNGVRRLCRQHGVVLIFDEVMTSRMSIGGAQRRLGVIPDMTTLGKYLGGGMTFGAFGSSAEIMGAFDPARGGTLTHGGTFNNNAITMGAGAMAVERLLTEDALNRLFESRLSASEIRSHWLASTAVAEFERGRIPPTEFAERFVREWGLDWPPARFLEAFASWVQPLSADAAAILTELSPSYEVACLSNCNEVHWARLETIRPHFDRAFLSFEMGLVKPDPGIFERVLLELDVRPERITFFDDSDENLHAARALGLRAERVRGVKELRARLGELGML